MTLDYPVQWPGEWVFLFPADVPVRQIDPVFGHAFGVPAARKLADRCEILVGQTFCSRLLLGDQQETHANCRCRLRIHFGRIQCVVSEQ